MSCARFRRLLTAACVALMFAPACDEEPGNPGTPAEPDASSVDGETDAAEDGSAETAGVDGSADVVDDGSGAPEGGTTFRACSPFGASHLSPADDRQPFLVIADFDCDLRPDVVRGQLVLGERLSGRIDFYPGMGDGTFNPAVAIEPGGLPVKAVAGDFNGDGVSDLVVTVRVEPGRHRLLLYRGECREGLRLAAVLFDPSPYLATDMAVADLNHDGRDDLILSLWDSTARVDVLLGGPEPFLSRSSSETFPGWVSNVRVADIDGDGDKDVIAVRETRWDVFINDGTGALTYVAHRDTDASRPPEAIDVDADGAEELITLRMDGVVDVYRYEPETGKFARAPLFEAPGKTALVVGDITGNAREDIALVGADRTELMLTQGDQLTRIKVPFTEGTLALADVTGDARTDLVYGTSYALEVFPNVPASCDRRFGTCEAGDAFGETTTSLGFAADRLLFGDVNGDHTTDIVVSSSDVIGVLRTNIRLQPEKAALIEIASRGMTIADLDDDRAAEIIVIDQSAGWTEIRGDGDVRHVRPEGFPAAANVYSGDFDCDGRADLVFEPAEGPASLVFVPAGEPDARFDWGDGSGYGARILRAADFEADGCADLLLQPLTPWMLPCIVKGPIRTDSRCEGSIPIGSNILDVGDLDGDRAQELLMSRYSTTIASWEIGASEYQDLLTPDHGWFAARFLRAAKSPPALLLAAKGGALEIHASDGGGRLLQGEPKAVQLLGRDLSLVETRDLDGDGTDEIVGVATTERSVLSVFRSCK